MRPEIDSPANFRQWRILFLLVASVLVIDLLVAVISVTRMKLHFNEMSRVMQMAMAVRSAYSAIQDVEISERNYLLGRSIRARKVYQDSVLELMAQMERMESIETGPRVRVLVQDLNALMTDRLNTRHIAINDAVYDETKFSVESWNAQEATALLLKIRSSVEAIEATYERLMIARTEDIQRLQAGVFFALAVVTGLSLASMILIYRVAQQALARQATWEDEQVLQRQDLERRVAERTEDLQRYSLELQRSNKELEDFAFVASHDLQEPLRKIMAFGDRLEMKHAQDLGDGIDYLNRMRAAAQRMARLINDLLEFSRVATHPGSFKQISLDKVLGEVMEDLEEMVASSNARVTVDPLPEIEADETQMHQLLQNLIVNAIKFVDSNRQPAIRITSRILLDESPAEPRVDRRRVELQVIDNGIGLDEAYKERIFKPFQRLHSQGNYSGTGIGLAVCKRIVERHGGTLTVESQLGYGSVFIVNLPVSQASVEKSRSFPERNAEMRSR
jgi:signal transduction histidine kinase